MWLLLALVFFQSVRNSCFGSRMPSVFLEPRLMYWEATQDPEAGEFALELGSGECAELQEYLSSRERLRPDGSFFDHTHGHTHHLAGMARRGAT